MFDNLDPVKSSVGFFGFAETTGSASHTAAFRRLLLAIETCQAMRAAHKQHRCMPYVCAPDSTHVVAAALCADTAVCWPLALSMRAPGACPPIDIESKQEDVLMTGFD